MNSTAPARTDSRLGGPDVRWAGFDDYHSPDNVATTPKCSGSIVGALIATLPAAPILAALFTAAHHLTHGAWAAQLASLLNPFGEQTGPTLTSLAVALSLSVAPLIFLAAWSLLALGYYALGFTAADRASAGSYGALCDRERSLQASLQEIAQGPAMEDETPRPWGSLERIALQEAMSQTDSLRGALACGGPQWVLGSGYINLWHRAAEAEEALIQVAPRASVITGGWYDRLRCTGSAIEAQSKLSARAELAVQFLRNLPLMPSPIPATSADGNGTASQSPPSSQPTRGAAAAPGAAVDGVPSSEAEARLILRDVRHAINQFRNERWAGLVRARNVLRVATTLTGITLYALLWFVIPTVESETKGVGAGAFFFFIGAMVGLFSHAYVESRNGVVVDDYGLSCERLVATPIISGVAAVAGVVAMWALGMPSGGPSEFVKVFDHTNLSPLSVVVAATFGFAPGLLLDQLQQQVRTYKKDLQSTRAAEVPTIAVTTRAVAPASIPSPSVGEDRGVWRG